MKSSRHIWLFGAMLLFLCGCVEEMDYYEHPSEYITFVTGVGSYETRASDVSVGVSGRLGVEERDWPVEAGTKATPVVSLSGDAGIIAYQYSGGWKGTETSWLTNSKFTFEGNMLAGDPVRWTSVSSDNLKVFAYAPYIDLSAAGISSLTGVPSIPYEIASTVAEQTDLVEAEADVTVSSAKGKSIPLDFRHVLTAVRFKMGFAATVKSVTVSGVYGSGIFTIGSGWTPDSSDQTFYEINFGDTGKSVKANEMLTDDALTLMLMPQKLTSSAKVVVTYSDKDPDEFSLAGKTWTAGRMVTYTLYDEEQNTPIYFDLAAGDVFIGYDPSYHSTGGYENGVTGDPRYSGYIYVGGVKQKVEGQHVSTNKYYVYQSTGAEAGDYDGTKTGWESALNSGTCRIPDYPAVKYGSAPWREFIENNTSVASVIKEWNVAAESAKRNSTEHRISVRGKGVSGEKMSINLTVKDIFTTYAERNVGRTRAGISFISWGNAELMLNIIGDNRVGAIHYYSANTTNRLVFDGIGTITVAAADGSTTFYNTTNGGEYIGEEAQGDTTFFSNHWCSAIGGNDSRQGLSHGIVINGGNIFAGTTKAENCSAIGAGGNDHATITINGGTVTAVASTTGTAIGGGIGYNSAGGTGTVTITGGNVYAYNHANRWDIPSSAIGGAGSRKDKGNKGTVNISGGNVYAQSAIGTAIGGGSSKTKEGGEAIVNISGGHVIARSISAFSGENPSEVISAGAGIGGGTGCSGGVQTDESINVDGGRATINISGNAVVETGSIGGGRSGHVARGKLGTAFITVNGGYTMAQFVMAAGADDPPQFNMTGGLIRSSNTTDGADDYYNIVKNGGAVYMEDGSFDMSGGTIMDCSAEKGGAVYISKGAKAKKDPEFKMSGGTIENCSASGDGGAVYLENGSVTISGTASILHNRSKAYGGAVCVRKTATSVPSFTMSGGSLSRNTSVSGGGAVYIEGGNVTVSDGTVSGNIVEEGNGGAICINSGSFVMSEGGDAEINGNVAQMSAAKVGGYGGGVYVTSTSETVEVDIFSGRIEGNSSAKRGGGIAVDMSAHPSVEAEVIVGKAGSTGVDVPDITGNVTLYEGGGLYVNGTKADVVINSGRILSNRTVGYVANPDVVNEGGMVTLNGGDVESVTVTYDGNGAGAVSTGGNSSESQKIVTDTNNRLKIPAFTRSGYRFVRWNTRPDGLGPKDYVDGETVKRSSDLILYAIWELD